LKFVIIQIGFKYTHTQPANGYAGWKADGLYISARRSSKSASRIKKAQKLNKAQWNEGENKTENKKKYDKYK